MFIDKKGKLFGKVNIIDFILIVLILAVIAFIAIKAGSSTVSSSAEKTLVVQYYAEEVSDFVANQVQVGDELLDDGRNCSLGTVTKVEVGPSQSYSTTESGESKLISRDKINSILITSEVKGEITPTGCVISSNKYGVGHSMTLRAGKAKIYLRVYDYQVKE